MILWAFLVCLCVILGSYGSHKYLHAYPMSEMREIDMEFGAVDLPPFIVGLERGISVASIRKPTPVVLFQPESSSDKGNVEEDAENEASPDMVIALDKSNTINTPMFSEPNILTLREEWSDDVVIGLSSPLMRQQEDELHLEPNRFRCALVMIAKGNKEFEAVEFGIVAASHVMSAELSKISEAVGDSGYVFSIRRSWHNVMANTPEEMMQHVILGDNFNISQHCYLPVVVKEKEDENPLLPSPFAVTILTTDSADTIVEVVYAGAMKLFRSIYHSMLPTGLSTPIPGVRFHDFELQYAHVVSLGYYIHKSRSNLLLASSVLLSTGLGPTSFSHEDHAYAQEQYAAAAATGTSDIHVWRAAWLASEEDVAFALYAPPRLYSPLRFLSILAAFFLPCCLPCAGCSVDIQTESKQPKEENVEATETKPHTHHSPHRRHRKSKKRM